MKKLISLTLVVLIGTMFIGCEKEEVVVENFDDSIIEDIIVEDIITEEIITEHVIREHEIH